MSYGLMNMQTGEVMVGGTLDTYMARVYSRALIGTRKAKNKFKNNTNSKQFKRLMWRLGYDALKLSIQETDQD